MSSTETAADGTSPRRTRGAAVRGVRRAARRFRRFVFPMTALFLAWYFLYVLLAAFAPDFMATKVVGNINVGLLFGLRPVRVDVRHHDHLRPLGRPPARPAAERLRAQIEGADAVSALGRCRPSCPPPPRSAPRRSTSPSSRRSSSSRSSSSSGPPRNNSTAADYYAGGRRLHRRARTAWPSRATTSRPRRFLGIAGAIALNGYDGFLYSIGFLVAWLVALLLVAELLRNTGRFTMADVLSFRLKQRPVRMAAAISTLAVSLLLPAGPDGRRRRPGRPAARHRRRDRRRTSSSSSSAAS